MLKLNDKPGLGLFTLLCCICVPFAAAAKLTIAIPPSIILPNPGGLTPSTHATLTLLSGGAISGPLRASLNRDSKFVFAFEETNGDGVDSYILDIHARDIVFAVYRVDVGAGATIEGVWETFRGNEWSNKGPLLGSGAGHQEVEIRAKAVKRRDFYEARAGFSPLSLLKNPMILLGVVALGITFGMPYLIDNMDPEARAEFEEQSRKSPLIGLSQGALPGGSGAGGQGFDLAGWMAGATSPSSSASASTGRDTGGVVKRS